MRNCGSLQKRMQYAIQQAVCTRKPEAMSNARSVIDEMRQQLDLFNPAERRLAEAILGDISGATRLTTRELSRRALVSEPTVVRFARRMGSTGFTTFKLRLSEDFATGRMFIPSESPAVSLDASAIANQVYEATAQALAFSFAQRDPLALAAASEAIDAARRVFCLGVGGSSANVASEAANRLFRFGISAAPIIDPYSQTVSAALCGEPDALLVFSVTGRPPSLLSSASLARQQGAAVIAVTRPSSPLAAAASVTIGLDIPDDDRRPEIPNRSRYGQLYVLDCLATLVGARRLDGAAAGLQRAREALLAIHGPTEQQPIGD
jgi:RpiR family transcriptional regulator, carbohydrate utilization regulator